MRYLFVLIISFSIVSVNGQELSIASSEKTKSKNPIPSNLTLSVGKSQFSTNLLNRNSEPSLPLSPSQQILSPAPLPKYARENPAGHSYLCRLEVKIEKKLPIGVWMKVGDSAGIMNSTGNNAHLRLRLKSF